MTNKFVGIFIYIYGLNMKYEIPIYMLYNFLTKKHTLQEVYAQVNNEAHLNILILICRHILHFPNDST